MELEFGGCLERLRAVEVGLMWVGVKVGIVALDWSWSCFEVEVEVGSGLPANGNWVRVGLVGKRWLGIGVGGLAVLCLGLERSLKMTGNGWRWSWSWSPNWSWS